MLLGRGSTKLNFIGEGKSVKTRHFFAAVIFAGSALVGGQAVADTTINASQVGNISTENLKSYQELTVNWSTEAQNVGLLQFDVSSLAGTAIPRATLNLYHLYNNAFGAVFNLYANTSSWNSSINSWSALPSHLSSPVATLTIDEYGDHAWRSVDVTNVVNQWASGSLTNYGLTLMRVDQANPVAYFSATGNAPTLTISAVPEPETYAMLMAGLGLLGALSRRKKNL